MCVTQNNIFVVDKSGCLSTFCDDTTLGFDIFALLFSVNFIALIFTLTFSVLQPTMGTLMYRRRACRPNWNGRSRSKIYRITTPNRPPRSFTSRPKSNHEAGRSSSIVTRDKNAIASYAGPVIPSSFFVTVFSNNQCYHLFRADTSSNLAVRRYWVSPNAFSCWSHAFTRANRWVSR